MFFYEYFLNNYPMFFELVGLLVILIISVHVSKKIKFYMRSVVALIVFSVFVHIMEAWTQTFDTLSIWRPILTSFKYCCYPAILIVLICMISEIWSPLSPKWIWIMVAPLLASAVLFFTSQWTHWVFFYYETNNYAGGALSWWPYILFALYLAVFVFLNILYLKRYTRRNRIIVLYITFASVLCVILYLIQGDKDDYNPIFTASLVFYFLFIYIRMAAVDALTGLLNRSSYYQYMIEKGEKITQVVSIDMNDLKLINDTEGHAAGDEALRTLASTLRHHAGPHSECFRIGGDEFVIIYTNESSDAVEAHIDEMREALSSKHLTCAFGYAERKGHSNLEEILKIADEAMYADKVAIKAKK